jgi:hypothetical protein
MSTDTTTTNGQIDVSQVVRLTRIEKQTIEIPIVGITPLIPHKWSEKAKRMMREKQSAPTKARAKLAAKDAAEEAEASLYRLPDGRPGMPATAFKAATVGGARFYGKDVTIVMQKISLFVLGEGDDQLVPIVGDMTMREDTPRNAGGVVDLRYRYSFWPWSAVLSVQFIPSAIDAESVVNLIDAGGNGGVGDWRPSAPKSLTGTFGRYRVDLS